MTQPSTATPTSLPTPSDHGLDVEFRRGLGLFDATMMVSGTMIGSGIFIVSADMGRLLGSPGWLLIAWAVTGVLTVTAALSYGELAGMMPRAGGQYVYLREAYSPLWGFLYGWTLFAVIQTGTIAAVAVAFAKFTSVTWPSISLDNYLIEPIHLTSGYAVSLSTGQALGIGLIAALTATNVFGLQYGKFVQNLFTVAKIGALLAVIVLGLTMGFGAAAGDNWRHFWTPRGEVSIVEGLAAATAWGLFVAVCISQTGSLFSADAWNNVTFAAGEVRDPRRTLPWALGLGTSIVILLYLLANVAYLAVLPWSEIQNAPDDRVGTAMMARLFEGRIGVVAMVVAIMISTFGCTNGLILSGARAYYAMARDGLFFPAAGKLNAARVPAWGLLLQGVWAALLVLPRTVQPWSPNPASAASSVGLLAEPSGQGPLLAVTTLAATTPVRYGNLYGDLLDYIISAALLFYALTIIGIFRLRWTRPEAPRPYRAFGYPVVPALYVIGAMTLVGVLVVYRPMTTWPGLVLVALGVPVYFVTKAMTRRGG